MGPSSTSPRLHDATAIRFSGRDALAVLHRISTNALDDLAPGEARATSFCDFRGRLLHRAAVARGADAVWLVRPDAPAAELLAHVERHVFREDARAVSGEAPRLAVRYESPRQRGSFEERDGRPHRIELPSGETLEWIEGTPPAPDDVARIRAGLPRHGFEIRDAFHPFEVGLAGEVHLAKGCYTGQEALQRLVTYRGVRRRLVLLSGPGDAPEPGASVFASGEPAGLVTSGATHPGGYVALAVMRRAAMSSARDGTTRSTADVEGAAGAVVEPFPEARPRGLP